MNIIEEFLSIQQHIRVYHWTTSVYNQHVVSGELYEKLDSLFDKFIETFAGKYKIVFAPFTISVSTNKNLLFSLKRFKQFLMTDLELMLHSNNKNTDLKNIRDEILGEINKFTFLLKMK